MIRANLAYAIGSAARSAALFFLIPFLVNAFTPEEYGAWALLEVAIILLNSVFLAGVNNGLMRRHWMVESEQERLALAGTALISVVIWGGFLVGSLWFIVILGNWKFPGAPATLILILLISYAEAISDMFLAIYRIREKAMVFVSLSLGRMIAFLGFSIWFVFEDRGLAGALVGRLIAAILSIFASYAVGTRYFILHFDWKKFIWMARYGLPLLPTNIASYILFASDRYILGYFSTLETVAIYTFAYKISTVLDVLVTRPFATDWAPRRFKISVTANASRKYSQILVLYLWITLGAALLIIAWTPTIFTQLAPELYRIGMSVVPVILFAYIVYGLSYPLNVGIMIKDQTRFLPLVGWLAAGVCLGLNLWWIPRYGMFGAAWATVAAYVIWTGGIAWVSLQLYPIRYSLYQIGWVVASVIVGYGGLWVLDRNLAANDGILALVLRTSWVLALFLAVGIIIWRNSRLKEAREKIQIGKVISS